MIKRKSFLIKIMAIIIAGSVAGKIIKYKNINKKKIEKINIIFDFDSTIVKNETLNDILATAINNDKTKIKQIENITNRAMNGEITPQQSMNERLKLATINKQIVEKITDQTTQNITEGMIEVLSELKQNKNIELFIVSGGFKETILPTAKKLGFKTSHIFANNFKYNNKLVSGVKDSILLQQQGKVKIIQQLRENGIIKGKAIMIGDGYTDLETKLYNVVDIFIAFTKVAKRENVIKIVKEKGDKQGFFIANEAKDILNIIKQ